MSTANTPILRTAAALVLCAGLQAPLRAQAEAPPSTTLAYFHDTGPVSRRGAAPGVVLSFPVHVAGADWLRLAFDRVDLAGDLFAGEGAILRVTSTLDGAVQELNALHVRQWRRTTAYFNGDTVLVEVVAYPGTGPSRVVLDSVTAGWPPAPDSQCGPTDDRVLSSDARSARLLPVGCTGWLIADCAGCFLTAGHCDGGLSVAQFNVPLSTGGGALNNPSPDDQYAVDAASLQSNGGLGVGDDWAYFGTFANSNTGLTARQAQGAAFALATPPFDGSETIRITGYGTDNTPLSHNQVQQTHVGPWVTYSGTILQYQTDTEGGNSGSPVIHEPTGDAIGIHTHGGCQTSGAGANAGTSLAHGGVQAALANPQGVCTAGGAGVVSPPAYAAPGSATDVDMAVAGTIVPGTALLHWRVNGGSFTQQAMTDLGGGLYRGTLPAGSCGDVVDYWVSADHSTCGPVTDPGNAPASFFSLNVVETLFSDDFETDKGWTAQNLGAATGDWERGVPVNDPGWDWDPASDSDGSGSCFLTMNQLGNTDVDAGAVQLTSPLLDLSGGGVEVRYDYYLNMNNPAGVDRLLVEISPNGAAGPWTQVALHGTDGGLAWRSHAITEADITTAGVSLTSAMALRFIANDSDPQSIVEAGLDAFRVVTTACCAGGGTTYCAPKTNACGVGALAFSGLPSASASSGFVVTGDAPMGGRLGVLLYNEGAGPPGPYIPFGGTGDGVLCVKVLELTHARAAASGGVAGQCGGAQFAVDMNAFAAGALGGFPRPYLSVPGTVVHCQWWGRELPSSAYLSDGGQYTICP